ncbi:MAG: hypothetical protein D8M57_18310 [Candidatus Scalindua sp. AMX11]|nr:MAG: hypothetical protein DWQ00_10215 [Candidatus Scalindua sp.]NOG85188.1 hypothetical protein [Planctomycetota bacterium]RZV64324.1 MAG: hypothetical protein EX341_18245 [Candidatus Scalindua sp. SCAELEC01]TDE63432.1 MAG: hypothetical protein D8M57_18310 [Candidatus Scalindua sp. AMX11]GJQ57314.1 MAG: hypothetical protein SCALA701_01150 [Candidatus Scalindua sp.]
MKKNVKGLIGITLVLLMVWGVGAGYKKFYRYRYENTLLKKIVNRLEADSRVAEILVTDTNEEKETGQKPTTIKFLEYDINGAPLEPKYFTFSSNIIQFQSLVIRFEDMYIRQRDQFRGKSAFIFWKAFYLNGENTEEYVINEMYEIPSGYKLPENESRIEKSLWKKFWQYALDQKVAKEKGIKNAQIEAPGSLFLPGYLYTLKIEHDGGLRIDSRPFSHILRGEHIP